MEVKSILEEITKDVQDLNDTDFTYYITKKVPSSEDPNLTFERGVEKKGKVIKTCVLYADIRNSVNLTAKHHSKTMGKIYTAFTKAVLKVANYHNGFTRNIIGDRVMVVFPEKDCFSNAVDCAISINHISKYIISNEFKNVDFKCGIGIDYGKLRVIKVGIEKRGQERIDNKNLVWVGYPANIASRLTDIANKVIQKEAYDVEYKPVNYGKLLGGHPGIRNILGEAFNKSKEEEPFYLNNKKEKMSKLKFTQNLFVRENGEISFLLGKLISAEETTINFSYPPILMTEKIFKNFKRSNPNRKRSILDNLWKPQKHNLSVVGEKIYGGDIHWTVK